MDKFEKKLDKITTLLEVIPKIETDIDFLKETAKTLVEGETDNKNKDKKKPEEKPKKKQRTRY